MRVFFKKSLLMFLFVTLVLSGLWLDASNETAVAAEEPVFSENYTSFSYDGQVYNYMESDPGARCFNPKTGEFYSASINECPPDMWFAEGAGNMESYVAFRSSGWHIPSWYDCVRKGEYPNFAILIPRSAYLNATNGQEVSGTWYEFWQDNGALCTWNRSDGGTQVVIQPPNGAGQMTFRWFYDLNDTNSIPVITSTIDGNFRKTDVEESGGQEYSIFKGGTDYYITVEGDVKAPQRMLEEMPDTGNLYRGSANQDDFIQIINIDDMMGGPTGPNEIEVSGLAYIATDVSADFLVKEYEGDGIEVVLYNGENEAEIGSVALSNSGGFLFTGVPRPGVYRVEINERLDNLASEWAKRYEAFKAAAEAENVWDKIQAVIDMTDPELEYLTGSATVTVDDAGAYKDENGHSPVHLIIVADTKRASESSIFNEALKSAVYRVLEFANTAINNGSAVIHTLLVWGNDIEDETGAIAVWKITRNMALSLLTLGLLLIAFANLLSINLSQYGLARIIPKLVMSVVLTFFSYLIAAFLLDLMSALQSLSLEGQGSNYFALSQSINGYVRSGIADAGSAIGELLFLAIVCIFIVLTIGYLCIVLMIRTAMIYILIAVAPIAFMANILPFTEKYYKQWWGAFWKWAFMGPAITFMLWLSGAFLVGYSTEKFGPVSNSIDAWFWLIAAAVCIGLAGAIPMKLGGEIYSKVKADRLAPGNLAKGAYNKTGLKDRVSAFQEGRKQYGKLKANKDATWAREKIGRIPYVGGIAAGTRGILGQDKDIARQMYAARYKETDQKESEDRLGKITRKGADYSNPEVLALMEKIAGEFHQKSWSDATKDVMAPATAKGLDPDKATFNPDLQRVSRRLEINPDKEAVMGLYNHAMGNGGTVMTRIESLSPTAADALEKAAVKKAAGVTIVERGGDRMEAITNAEDRHVRQSAAGRRTPSEGYEMAHNTHEKDKAFRAAHPEVIEEKATAAVQKDHEDNTGHGKYFPAGGGGGGATP